jgi:hypothetical protein
VRTHRQPKKETPASPDAPGCWRFCACTDWSKLVAKASKPSGPFVRVSVPLDARNHAKLCALAALRSADRSTTAAEILMNGLKGVVVIDPRSKTDPVESKESATLAIHDKNSALEDD